MVESATTATVLVRMRMADRPGALGAVAGRIGGVRGDLVSIEILERSDGWVIDEVVVELPSIELCALMIREIGEVDDVEVIDVVTLGDSMFDHQLSAFEVADILIGSDTSDELLGSLCVHTRRVIRSDWVAVVGRGGEVLASAGRAPSPEWLAAFMNGDGDVDRDLADQGRSSRGFSGTSAFWVPLPGAEASLVLGRSGSSLRARERQRAAALARIADTWLTRIRRQRRLSSMLAHPSGGGDY